MKIKILASEDITTAIKQAIDRQGYPLIVQSKIGRYAPMNKLIEELEYITKMMFSKGAKWVEFIY